MPHRATKLSFSNFLGVRLDDPNVRKEFKQMMKDSNDVASSVTPDSLISMFLQSLKHPHPMILGAVFCQGDMLGFARFFHSNFGLDITKTDPSGEDAEEFIKQLSAMNRECQRSSVATHTLHQRLDITRCVIFFQNLWMLEKEHVSLELRKYQSAIADASIGDVESLEADPDTFLDVEPSTPSEERQVPTQSDIPDALASLQKEEDQPIEQCSTSDVSVSSLCGIVDVVPVRREERQPSEQVCQLDVLAPFRDAGILGMRLGHRTSLEHVRLALQQADATMAKYARTAQHLAEKLFGAGKNWEDEWVKRSSPRLPCEVCGSNIMLSAWPGSLGEDGMREGWGCGTCAKLLTDRGYHEVCPPTIWCCAACKKEGQKRHAWPGEGRLSRKDNKKVKYCDKVVSDRIASYGTPCGNKSCTVILRHGHTVSCSCKEIHYCSQRCLDEHRIIHLVRCKDRKEHLVARDETEPKMVIAIARGLVQRKGSSTSTCCESAEEANDSLTESTDVTPSSTEQLEVINSDDDDEPGDTVPRCVICLTNAATHVGKKCGHLAWCRTCRRKAVHAVLGCGSKNNLNLAQLERTVVECPVCRQHGCIVSMNGRPKDLERVEQIYVCLETAD